MQYIDLNLYMTNTFHHDLVDLMHEAEQIEVRTRCVLSTVNDGIYKSNAIFDHYTRLSVSMERTAWNNAG